SCELAHHQQLTFPVFGYRAGEVVVRGDTGDLQTLALYEAPHSVTSPWIQIHRIAMRTLAVQLDAVIPVVLRPLDDLLKGQGRTVVPDSHVADGVETDLHRCASRKGKSPLKISDPRWIIRLHIIPPCRGSWKSPAKNGATETVSCDKVRARF